MVEMWISKQLEIETPFIWIVANKSYWPDSLAVFQFSGDCEDYATCFEMERKRICDYTIDELRLIVPLKGLRNFC